MISFFTLGKTNELILKGHSYIYKIGLSIINDKQCKGESNLDNYFYNFLDLLDVIETRKDFDLTKDNFQKLVLKLYSIVDNECVYYNSRFIDIEGYPFDTSINIDLSDYATIEYVNSLILTATGAKKSVINISDNTNPTVIDWKNDLAPNEDGTLSNKTFIQKHGSYAYAYSSRWKNNITNNFEKTEAFTLEDEYNGSGELIFVTINPSDIPFKLIII